MHHLTVEMIDLIAAYNAGAVATVNDDGTPRVSPKATFIVLDENTIAFGDIRSPGTVSNIRQRPAVEINFIDVLRRRAVRVTGTAQVIDKDSEQGQALVPSFDALWSPYVARMKNFVRVDIAHAQLVLSPAYDIGLTAHELHQTNLEKLSGLQPDPN